jgi:hypothetical protein
MKAESEGSGSDASEVRALLDAELEEAREPLRPDRIERARLLLSDPGYPGIEVARALARTIMPVLE